MVYHGIVVLLLIIIIIINKDDNGENNSIMPQKAEGQGLLLHQLQGYYY
jgi:hypothetical protein